MPRYRFNFQWMFARPGSEPAEPDERALDFLDAFNFDFVRIPTDYRVWTPDFDYFHIVSERALTLRGFAQGISAWFGQPPRLEFQLWDKWREQCSPQEAAATWDHIAHNPNCSIEKARKLIGYQPRYSSLQAVTDSLEFFQAKGLL